LPDGYRVNLILQQSEKPVNSLETELTFIISSTNEQSMITLANFFRSPDISNLNSLQVMGILANGIDIGPKGVHLRWMFPPAPGIPKLADIYRRPHDSTQKLPADICSDAKWVQIGSIARFDPHLQSYFDNLDNFNYYLTKDTTQRNGARMHYQGSIPELRGLFDFLSDTRNFSNPEIFENPGNFPSANLSNLQFKVRDDKPFSGMKPIGLVAMAAQDPNLARMMGLYFVDTAVPDYKKGFDYKIELSYSGSSERPCGFVLNIGNEQFSKVPALGSITARELEDKTWAYSNLIDKPKLMGRIGLKWQKPRLIDGDAAHLFNEPVLFAVKRSPDFKSRLSSTNPRDKLVTVPDQNYQNPLLHCFTDVNPEQLLVGNFYEYMVIPVTIFGQAGEKQLSNKINLGDVIPVPPVSLSIQEAKPEGQPLQQKLRFKFGAAQYFLAPHTKRFNLWSRHDTLADKALLGYQLETFNGKNFTRNNQGYKKIILIINTDKDFSETLKPLSGDLNSMLTKPFHTAEFSFDTTGKPLPNARIRRFSISRFIGNNKIEIIVDTETNKSCEIPSAGFVVLIKDPHTTSPPSRWNANGISVNLHPPKPLLLTSVKQINFSGVQGFEVKVSRKFLILPLVDRIGGNPISPKFTELFFNRALLEQGIFDGGTVTIGSVTPRKIVYQGGGLASTGTTPASMFDSDAKKAQFARILVEGDFPEAVPGAKMVMKPAAEPGRIVNANNPLSGLFVLKFNAVSPVPGGFGDLLLKVKQMLQLEAARTKTQLLPVSVPVLSDFSIIPGGMEVLIRLNKEVSSLTPEIINHSAFFSHYEVDVTSIIAARRIPANTAVSNTYFALQSETDGAVPVNRSLLSAPAQYYAPNLAVPAAPGVPEPCVLPPAGEKAFLPPPDQKGYAVNCITWPLVTDLRYEIYRTLDATLLIAHRNEFLKGNAIVTPGLTIPVAIIVTAVSASSTDATTGFVTADFTIPAGSAITENDLLNARMDSELGTKTNSYQVVAAKPSATVLRRFSLNLKPILAPHAIPIQALRNTATFRITRLPDYAAVMKNDAVLSALADQPELIKAYSLVSIVPVRTNSFNDVVPGKGNNRFFYKIRAVSASEVRSPFSATSVPIYQMDTTPPEAIQEFSAHSLDNRAILVWKNNRVSYSRAWKLIKETTPASGGAGIKSETDLQESSLLPKPLFLSNAQTIVFNQPLIIPVPARLRIRSAIPTDKTDKELATLILLHESHPPGNILVPATQYRINYTINLPKMVYVVGSIEFEKKRDAGVFFEITANNQSLTAEQDYLCFIDDAVATGDQVQYTLVPVKLAGPSPQVRIAGAATNPQRMVIRNFASPRVMVTRQFINPGGLTISTFEENARVKLTVVKSDDQPAFIRVTKHKRAPQTARVISTTFTGVQDGKTLLNWIPVDDQTLEIIDNQFNKTNDFDYTIEVKNDEDIFLPS
jgi:hypothetical protein